MKITRINRIKGHRIFENFAWPSDLPDFSRFNLIYGWNATGKTTFSNLLRHIQLKESVLEGEIDFEIDGNSLPGASLAAATGLPRIRVFNRDFVETNVFRTLGAFEPPKGSLFQFVDVVKPIFFLGKDSVEKQKQVEELCRTHRVEVDSQRRGSVQGQDEARLRQSDKNG
jgi:wobble nucleotide-excising tRNase